MKKRKFAEGGMPALEALASGQESGGLDKDTYARALSAILSRLNEDEGSAGTAKPAAKRARKVEMPAPVSEAKAKPTVRVEVRDHVLLFALKDNVKARELNADGFYTRVQAQPNVQNFDSQREQMRLR